MSAARAIVRGFPLSRVSSCANSSARCSIRSASFQICLPQTETVIFLQGPLSKALRADFTARSISSFSPLGTRVRTLLLEGSRTSKVSPLAESTRFPSINSFCGEARKSLIAESGCGAVAVVMTISNQARESKISRDIPHLINFGCTSIIILIGKEIKFFFSKLRKVWEKSGQGYALRKWWRTLVKGTTCAHEHRRLAVPAPRSYWIQPRGRYIQALSPDASSMFTQLFSILRTFMEKYLSTGAQFTLGYWVPGPSLRLV